MGENGHNVSDLNSFLQYSKRIKNIVFSYSHPTLGNASTNIRRIIESHTFVNENLQKDAKL